MAVNSLERVHIDFLGPFLGKMILVAVDAHSKWPEPQIMAFTTTAQTIAVLRDMFARNGLPKQVVSDNGPQFRAKEFKEFMARNGIQHVFTPPYHPASNGAAERLVQSVKQSLKASHQSGIPLQQALVLKYHTTPHSTTGVAPCNLFCKRNLRTRLDLLTPDVKSRVQKQQTKQKMYRDQHCHQRDLEVGQEVWAKNLLAGPRWRKGVICDKLGSRSYLVEVHGGELWRRHIDQLRTGTVSPQRTSELSRRESQGNMDCDHPQTTMFPEGDAREEETSHAELEEGEDSGGSSTTPVTTSGSPEHSTTASSPERSPLPLIEPTGSPETALSPVPVVEHQGHLPRHPTRTRREPDRLYGQMIV